MIAIAFRQPLDAHSQEILDQMNLDGMKQTVIQCDSCPQTYVLVHPESFGAEELERYALHVQGNCGACDGGHVQLINYADGLPSTHN